MTAAFDLDLMMPDDEKTPRPEPSLASNQWVQIIYGPVASAVMFAVIAGLAGAWRDAPMTSADVATLKAEAAQLRATHDALLLRVVSLESEGRHRSAEVAAIQKSVEEIKSYSGRTMTEVTEIKLQLAEDRGAKKAK